MHVADARPLDALEADRIDAHRRAGDHARRTGEDLPEVRDRTWPPA